MLSMPFSVSASSFPRSLRFPFAPLRSARRAVPSRVQPPNRIRIDIIPMETLDNIADLVIVSAFLAGMKRSTGLS